MLYQWFADYPRGASLGTMPSVLICIWLFWRDASYKDAAEMDLLNSEIMIVMVTNCDWDIDYSQQFAKSSNECEAHIGYWWAINQLMANWFKCSCSMMLLTLSTNSLSRQARELTIISKPTINRLAFQPSSSPIILVVGPDTLSEACRSWVQW